MLSLSLSAHSQPGTKSGERIIDGALYIDPASPFYPADLAERGAQGTVILLLEMNPDGTVKTAHVRTTSRSDELDAAAVRKALTMTYQGRGDSPPLTSLHIEFQRRVLDSKTCAEFNRELLWFRNAYPGRPDAHVYALQVAGNVARLEAGSRHAEVRGRLLDALPVALDDTVHGCANSPEARFWQVFNQALKDATYSRRKGSYPPEWRDDKVACAASTPCGAPGKLPRSILRIKPDDPIALPGVIRITPDMPAYPQELAAAGIQGQVTLHVGLTKTAEIAAVEVTYNQYGNADLARAAIAHIRKLGFARFASLDPVPAMLIVPVEFRKDTTETLTTKTCADFNVDLAAWRAASPKGRPVQMRVFEIGAEVLAREAFDRALKDSASPLRLPRGQFEIADKAAAACLAQPQSLFMAILRKEAGSAEAQ